jgi:hypothetical protein
MGGDLGLGECMYLKVFPPISLLAWVVTNSVLAIYNSRTLWNDLSIIALYRITGIIESKKHCRIRRATPGMIRSKKVYIKIC